jgi:hypothetical protein
MKPLPAPRVPGDTEFRRFDNAVRRVFSVSKEAFVKEEERLKKLRTAKRTNKSRDLRAAS